MTPDHYKSLCTHAPAYQHGCVWCNVRKLKLYRPDRQKQNAFLAGLSERDRELTISLIKAGA